MCPGPASLGGPLDGRWRLVEQKVGDGEWGELSEPLEIEFVQEGVGLSGKLHLGTGTERRVLDWPGVPNAGPASRVIVLEMHLAPEGDRVRVRYRAEPRAGAGEPLEIIEEYGVAQGGRVLVGQVTVGGVGGGSYQLRRRFERVR
jgi:hypothetical protein